MATRKRRTPSMRHHKGSGQAFVRLNGRNIYLGKFGTDEAQESYDRVMSEWLQSFRVSTPKELTEGVSVSELFLAYLEYAEGYYRRPDGSRTDAVNRTKRATQAMVKYYGRTPAREFGPKRLQALREELIAEGLARRTINYLIDEVRRAFKWGVAQELFAPSVYDGLKCVANLRAGRSNARETEPVKPVDFETVKETLPHLSPVVQDLIRFMMATGCRPGEACVLRPCDIETKHDFSDDVWLYRPASHKTAHHGKGRIIVLNGSAQRIVTPYLDRGPDEYCFPPSESEALRRIEMRRNRKTKVQPSQRRRKRKSSPIVRPKERYTPQSLANNVRRVVLRERITPWTPNMIRHTVATKARKIDSLEAARTLLGHSDSIVTTVYAEEDLEKAIAVARRLEQNQG